MAPKKYWSPWKKWTTAAGTLVIACVLWVTFGNNSQSRPKSSTAVPTEDGGGIVENFAPSKCFSCEKQTCAAYPQKCFDCEKNRSQEFWRSSHGSPRFFAGL